MNINRNNYESWFLQYVDQELAASEMKAVEAFVKAHPDLEAELEGFKQVVLSEDDAISMPGKALLLKPTTWNEEALNHQQEQLLLMADGELSPAETQKLQQEIASNILLNHEWELLQKTKLAASQPQTMPGKDALYRKEKTRVIPIGRILRIAVAAATIGFGWFAFQNMSNDAVSSGEQPDELVSVIKPSAKKPTGIDTITPEVVLPTSPIEESRSAPLFAASTEGQAAKNKIQPVASSTKNRIEDAANTNNNTKPKESMLAVNTPAAEPYAFIKKDTPNEMQGLASNMQQQGLVAQNSTEALVKTNTITEISTTTLIDEAQVNLEQASMVVYQIDEWEDDDETINIAGARINKQKFRSVYRNITRPITRAFDKQQDERIAKK